jgi:quinol monooxygenase YgiN
MEPVRLIVRIAAQDGKAEEVKGLLRKMIGPTRAERGCHYYEFFESNLPGVFYFHELWQSKEDLEAHQETKHFTEIIPKANALLKEPMEVSFLDEVQ